MFTFDDIEESRYLHSAFKNIPTPTLVDHLAEVVDRWTWDTASDVDRLLMESIEDEIAFRNKILTIRFLTPPKTMDYFSLETIERIQKQMTDSMRVDSSML